MRLRIQKAKARRRLVYLLTVVLLAGGAWLAWQWWNRERPRAIRYPEFGIVIPGGYAVHGIDVSKYQSAIDWEEVKAMQVKNIRLQFAFIKATEGTGHTDRHFFRNWEKSRKAGLLRGAYHFFIASRDGREQARHFLRTVDPGPGELPPVLDVEQLNGARPEDLRREALAWLREVEAACGVKPLLYTNVDFYQRYLGAEFDSYPLWVAHYYEPEEPRIGRGWVFWQHSDRGRVNGIRGEVDFNVFNGDSTDLRRLLLKQE